MSESNPPYILYGSYASYATAKTRSYLRKKGTPFVERVPGVPRFRETVRPATQNHRIPQLETGHRKFTLRSGPMSGYGRYGESGTDPAAGRFQAVPAAAAG